MDITKLMVDLKRQRNKHKKKSINVTVCQKRYKRLTNAIMQKSEFFELIGPSEQLEFLLYILERFMQNSEFFEIEIPEEELKEN